MTMFNMNFLSRYLKDIYPVIKESTELDKYFDRKLEEGVRICLRNAANEKRGKPLDFEESE